MINEVSTLGFVEDLSRGDLKVDRVRARKLQPYERQKLHKMKRQLANQVNSRHARIVLLSTGGVANAEIARLCDCTPQWVRRILHRFNAQGLDGITWFPFYADHTGQPRVFFADVVERIAEVALSPPKHTRPIPVSPSRMILAFSM